MNMQGLLIGFVAGAVGFAFGFLLGAWVEREQDEIFEWERDVVSALLRSNGHD